MVEECSAEAGVSERWVRSKSCQAAAMRRLLLLTVPMGRVALPGEHSWWHHHGTACPCALHQAATMVRLVATADTPPRLGVPAVPVALCWWLLPRSLASKLKVDAHHLVDMIWPRG